MAKAPRLLILGRLLHGGRQGMNEAQRFPEISTDWVIGAPG